MQAEVKMVPESSSSVAVRMKYPSGFLSVYAQQWDCWIIRHFYFQFLKESPVFSIVAVLVCIPTNSVKGFPFLHTLSSSHSDIHRFRSPKGGG